jgi:hypothetical protein
MMPYLASYLESIPTIYDERVKTMAVDSVGRLYVCPTFVLSLTADQAGYVLLHEVCHNLLGHADRRAQHIPTPNDEQLLAWNVAADLCIQQMLHQFDHLRPEGTVCIEDESEKYDDLQWGMSTERYYGIIWANRPEPPVGGDTEPGEGDEDDDGEGSGSGEGDDEADGDGDDAGDGDGEGEGDGDGDGSGEGPGDPSDKPGKGKGGKGQGKGGQGQGKPQPHQSGSSSDGVPKDYELETDLASVGSNMRRQEEVREEMEACNAQGSGAGTLRQSLTVRLRRQPDPFEQLKNLVGRAVATCVGTPEPTYRKRNRKQENDDLPMRGEFKINPDCTIIVDTSGSMGCGDTAPRVVKAMTAIAQGLRRVHQPRVIAWDGALQSDARISSLKQFAWQGGGGTSMDAAVVMADTKYKPDAIVLVTDGYTAWPANPTRARLIVALVDKGSTPPKWSKVVDLTKEAPSHVG